MNDKDHQASNNTTADRVKEADVNGPVMKNINLTTGVNVTPTTAADVKKSPASLETDSGNTQSGPDKENEKEVQSQFIASKTSNSTQSSAMGNEINQAGNGTERQKKEKSCFFGLCWGK